ncbi:hypothetical protein AAY473_007705, partial [Plecturocebus cupreus]
MGFHHVVQVGFKLLNPGDLCISTSQSAGVTGLSHDMEALSVTQAGMQCCDFSSLQPPPPKF